MRIAFLIKSMNTTGGGAERVLSEVVNGLAARGHQISLITYDRPADPSFYAVDPQIERIDLGIGAPRSRARLGETLARMRRLRRTFRSLKPDVAVGFMHSAYIPLAGALAGSGLPIVASEHISWDHFRTRPLQGALLRATPPLVQSITIMSPRIRDGFPANIRRAMVIVPNPVGVSPHGRADVVGEAVPIKRLLTVGRLEPQKDHKTLVNAFALVAPDCPDWELQIVGEGELRPQLERQIKALDLSNRIFLPGATADIGAVYRAAQLFVLPSLYESFGLVTVEAMAHGLPAIGFADCPGTNEIIVPGVNGTLVSGEDRPAALATELARLMRDPGERIRLGAGALDAAAPFLPEKAIARWEELLRSVVRPGERA